MTNFESNPKPEARMSAAFIRMAGTRVVVQISNFGLLPDFGNSGVDFSPLSILNHQTSTDP